jgi:acyl-CoA thioesterase FadM
MSAPLDVAYRVRFDEAGADGLVHASVLLAWAQDAAWIHSTSLGFDRAWYAARSLTWLVRAAELSLDDPPSYGDDVEVRTEVVGFRPALARRLTTYRTPGGTVLARSLTDWALIDGRGRPTRIPLEFSRLADAPTFEPLSVVPIPGGAVTTDVELTVRSRDVDPMGHANNAAYIGYVDEALAAAGLRTGQSAGRRRYRLNYVRPTPSGARLVAAVARVPCLADSFRVTLRNGDREVMRAEVDAA